MSTPIGPAGPYTPIVRAGPWLICSGQLGLHQPPTDLQNRAPRSAAHRSWWRGAPGTDDPGPGQC